MTDADPYPIAARGVYPETFTRKGRRGYYSVDSRGEQVGYVTVRIDRDPGDAIAELWDELNEVDPVTHDVASPFLRRLK